MPKKIEPPSVDQRHAALERALEKIEITASDKPRGTFSFKYIEVRELWAFLQPLLEEAR